MACLAVPGTASFEVPFLGAGLAEVFNACSFQTNCPRLSEKISAGLGMVFLSFPEITNNELPALIALFIDLSAAGSKSNEDVCI